MSLFPTMPPFGGVATVEFLGGAESTSDLTVYTFSSVDLAETVVVHVSGHLGDRTVSSLTVDGNSASLVVREETDSFSTNEIWIATGIENVSGDIVVTWSGSQTRTGILWWGLTGADTTAHDTAANKGTPPSASIDVPSGGVLIGGACANISGGTKSFSFTNLTEDDDAVIESEFVHAGGSDAYANAETVEVTATPGSTFSSNGLALASFGPA